MRLLNASIDIGHRMPKANSAVFNKSLDKFCRTYMVTNRAVTVAEQAALPKAHPQERHALLEQLLLFDTVAFKVTGENIPAGFLIDQIGLRGFEELLERGALRFVHWNQLITHFVREAPGVHPLQSGRHNGSAYNDPGASAEMGLRWSRADISAPRRRRLVTTIADLYDIQAEDSAKDAVTATHEAYQNGRLTAFGLDPSQIPLDNMPLPSRVLLNGCAVEISEYKLLLEKGWSSLSDFAYFKLFSESLERLTTASSVTNGFRHLAEIEGVPNIEYIAADPSRPLRDIVKIRARGSSERFREWLSADPGESNTELTRRYVDAIADRKGFFDRAPGRSRKAW